jgi:hypothetical protein
MIDHHAYALLTPFMPVFAFSFSGNKSWLILQLEFQYPELTSIN